MNCCLRNRKHSNHKYNCQSSSIIPIIVAIEIEIDDLINDRRGEMIVEVK